MATYYVDNTKESSTITGANWQFTNGLTTVTETGALGNAQVDLAAGVYVRTNGGTQWYKVASVTDADNFEITPAFQQANNTDTCKENSENGSAVGQDYASIRQGIQDTARVAADIIKLRANQTHQEGGLDISVNGDGTANSYITLKGADSIDDPWSDASDVLPIIDFNDTAFQIAMNGDNYWSIERFEIIQSADTLGGLFITASGVIKLIDLVIRDCSTYGVTLQSTQFEIRGLIAYENGTANTRLITAQGIISGCDLYGGGGGNSSNYGLYVASSDIWVKDSIFGITNDHDVADIFFNAAGIIEMRNCDLDSATQVATIAAPNSRAYTYVKNEDDGQVHYAYKAWYATGIVSRSTVVERSGVGGTDWSILGESNSNCGSEQPLYIIGDWLRGVPIYLDGGSQTITVWAYTDSTGGGWTPDNTEFYIEVEHYEGVADWEIDASAEAFVAEDTWTSFSVTLTPGAAGVAYLRAILKDNVAGAKLYIDPTPVFS